MKWKNAFVAHQKKCDVHNAQRLLAADMGVQLVPGTDKSVPDKTRKPSKLVEKGAGKVGSGVDDKTRKTFRRVEKGGGKVGSGVDDAMIKAMVASFQPLIEAQRPPRPPPIIAPQEPIELSDSEFY